MVTRNGKGQRHCKRKGNADREKERKEKKVIEREEEAVKI